VERRAEVDQVPQRLRVPFFSQVSRLPNVKSQLSDESQLSRIPKSTEEFAGRCTNLLANLLVESFARDLRGQ